MCHDYGGFTEWVVNLTSLLTALHFLLSYCVFE